MKRFQDIAQAAFQGLTPNNISNAFTTVNIPLRERNYGHNITIVILSVGVLTHLDQKIKLQGRKILQRLSTSRKITISSSHCHQHQLVILADSNATPKPGHDLDS